jgi:hypothetical protein
MKKQLPVLILLVLFLASCMPAAATPSIPVANATPTIKIIIPTPASCTSMVAAPTPGPEEPSVFPPVGEEDHVRGAENPVFTVMD